MRLRKRDGGCGDHAGAAVLGAVGLGAFARLDLRDPPEEPPLAASYDAAAGRITVSLGGGSVSASPADLAAALELPRDAAGLALGADAAVLSSTEAIAAVVGFIRDRVLLGGGVGGVAASAEVAAALRLVEEGKAYEVDWAGLVWAVLKGEVVAGTPLRLAPYLLRLVEYQRPEIFAEVDCSLPLRKRWKCQMLEQCQLTGEKRVICEEHEVEEEEETSLVDGLSQDIGDLEEMPIFGEGMKVDVAASVDFKRAFLESEEIHGLSQGSSEFGSRDCLPSDVKLLGGEMDCNDREGVGGGHANIQSPAEQDYFSSVQQVIAGTKSRSGSNPKHMIEIEDNDDDKVDVGPCIPPIRNAPLGITPCLLPQQVTGGICNYRALSPFDARVQEILGYVSCMKNGYLDREKACRDTRAEVECIKDLVREKERTIAATGYAIMKELEIRNTEMCHFEWDIKVMSCMVQQYKELLKKSLTEFQEYRNMVLCGEGVESYLKVLGKAGEQSRAWVQQMRYHQLQRISRFEDTWFSYYLKLVQKITGVKTGMEDLNHELRRLKDSRKIPDLNNDVEDDGASLSKMKDKDRAGEGGCVSSTTQGGKQPDELIANHDQRINTEESMDVNGVQGRCSEDEASHGCGASWGTS